MIALTGLAAVILGIVFTVAGGFGMAEKTFWLAPIGYVLLVLGAISFVFGLGWFFSHSHTIHF